MIAHVLRQHLASVTPVDDESDCPALEALIQLQSQPDCGLVELPGGASDQAVSLAQLARPHVLVLLGNDRPGSTPWQEAAPPTDECWESLLDSLADDGVAIVDGDDPALCRAAAERRQQTVLVGRGSHCDLIVRDVDGGGDGLSLQVDGVRLRVPVWGRHHVAAASSALAACRALRVSDRRIAAALAQFTPLAGRCQVVASRPVTVIDDTHRAGWTDTRAALAALRDTPTRARRVVLLGPIACQADDAVNVHRAVGEMVVTLAGAALLVACGPHADAVVDGAKNAGMRDDDAQAFASVDEALALARSRTRPGDVVLVKGSRASGIEKVAASLAVTETTRSTEQVRARVERPSRMPGLAPSENVEASPFASVMREAGATLPPG
jgi:UDP-N-acetylmuramoyl-tripeptide--D-alanyl-D-alanine ligase